MKTKNSMPPLGLVVGALLMLCAWIAAAQTVVPRQLHRTCFEIDGKRLCVVPEAELDQLQGSNNAAVEALKNCKRIPRSES